MKVRISSAAANSESDLTWLVRIQATFEDRWHIWSVEEPEELLSTHWLMDPGHAGKTARELLRQSVARSAYPWKLHDPLVTVDLEPSGEAMTFTPENAAKYLAQPLTILVEERDADLDFLKVVVAKLGPAELVEHMFALDPPPWKGDSRGGLGKMPAEIAKLAAARVPPRVFVVIDSDRNSPSSSLSSSIDHLQTACTAADIPLWILQKREIENYIPECLLLRLCQLGDPYRKIFPIWKSLDSNVKDYFDLKTALKPPRQGTRPADYLALFVSLPPADRQRLETEGFGGSVGRQAWADAAANDSAVDAEALRERAGDDELDRLVEELRRYF